MITVNKKENQSMNKHFRDDKLNKSENLLDEAGLVLQKLYAARNEILREYLNWEFKNGNSEILVKNVASGFGMKTRQLYDLIQSHMPDFACVRSRKGYKIVKKQKENQ
jgi:hypothetical protein